MLRVSGLWTPAGTSLLLSPDGQHSCLRVEVAGEGEGDGLLRLGVWWERGWDVRKGGELGVGWMRVELKGEGAGGGG